MISLSTVIEQMEQYQAEQVEKYLKEVKEGLIINSGYAEVRIEDYNVLVMVDNALVEAGFSTERLHNRLAVHIPY